MNWVLLLALLMLAPVCLVAVEVIVDILTYRDLQRRLRKERRRRG